jgi:arylsulfatase A-like enzyme
MVENHDFLPTILEYLNLKQMTPTNPPLAGKSFARALGGETIQWENVIFHEFENTRMIRTPKWKLTVRHPSGPDELYDMENDPEERANLIEESKYDETANDLRTKLNAFFAKHADPKYDRWRGGGTKGIEILRSDP